MQPSTQAESHFLHNQAMKNLNTKERKSEKKQHLQPKFSINVYTSLMFPIYSATVVGALVDAGGAVAVAPIAAHISLLNSPQGLHMLLEPAAVLHHWFAQLTVLLSLASFGAVPVVYVVADTAVLGVVLEGWAVAAAVR